MAVQLTASFSGRTVNVEATNTGSASVTLSAKVDVLLEDDTKETVYTNTATVEPNAKATLVGQASKNITEIIDEPEPIMS
jgi:hypothetical protein